MVSSILQGITAKKKTWILVPAVSFLGIIIGYVFKDDPVLGYLGILGCIISSFILGALAVSSPNKDIVAILAPLYSLIIFNPWSEYSTGYVMQSLFSLTILVVTLRFVYRFYSD